MSPLWAPVVVKPRLMCIPFGRQNVAANLTGMADSPGGASADWFIVGAVVPYAGRIVAISARGSAAAAGGTITFQPKNDTTGAWGAALTCAIGVQEGYQIQAAPVAVAAGERVNVLMQTQAGWTATTSDWRCWVWIEMD